MSSSPSPLHIFCDEAGHTGPDLLQAEQRYFAYGSTCVSDEEAFTIIQKARTDYQIQMPELKASKLLASQRGRRAVNDIFAAVEGRYCFNIHEKLLALCGWLFECVYEPVYQDDPWFLYEKNLHRFVAMYSWLWFNEPDGDGQAKAAIKQFQDYMRSRKSGVFSTEQERGCSRMDSGVFISYRRADAKWAEALAGGLTSQSIPVWYDGMIAPGQDWRDKIIENINLASIFIVLFSSEVNASSEILKEVAVASRGDKIILVVRIENIKPAGEYEYELTNRNWFDAFDNPARQLPEVASYIAEVFKKPGQLERNFKISADELHRRRKLRLLGHAGLLRNNTFLTFIFLAASIVQFFIYNGMTSAIDGLIAGGVSPLQAVLDVALISSLGSPLLLLAAIQQKLSGAGWMMPICSVVNMSVMVLWARNLTTSIVYKLSTPRQ